MDNLFLTGPLGTQWNIGSWLDKTAGVDYGAAGLVRQQLGQNAWAEGARLGFESAAGPRRMSFPLIVPSGGLFGLSLDAIEGSLRQMIRPGGFIDLQPANVPTAEMVRFDVLGGDVAHRNYSVDLQRVSRRQYTLSLETQPFGYWPTWIIAGSVASVALTGGGKLALPSAPIGDAPALAEIIIMPTAASFLGSEINLADGICWSLAGRPSFIAGLGGGSWGQLSYTASYGTDNSPPGRGISATYIFIYQPPATSGYGIPFVYNIPSAIEPAYRGRFHAFAKMYHDAARPGQLILDSQTENLAINGVAAAPMASANQIATIPATVPAAWHLLDLGELTLPAYASGVQQSQWLRLWHSPASWGATTVLELNGLYLLPIGGPAGVVTKGVAAGGGVTTDVPIHGATVNAAGVLLRPDLGALSVSPASIPIGDLRRWHYGQMPYIGATTVQLDLLGYDRKLGASSLIGEERAANAAYASVSVRYRPRFQFLKGL